MMRFQGPEVGEDEAREFLQGDPSEFPRDEDNREPCALCNGDGTAVWQHVYVDCPECDGRGSVPLRHAYYWCD